MKAYFWGSSSETVSWPGTEMTSAGTDDNGNPIGNYLIYEFDTSNKFYIEKRTITIKARSVDAFYGNDYSQDIVYDIIGEDGRNLAWNLTLKIDDQPIYDIPKIYFSQWKKFNFSKDQSEIPAGAALRE